MGTMNIVVDVSAIWVETLAITVLANEGRSMATKKATKKAAPVTAKKAVAKKAAPKMATPAKAAKAKPAAPKASRASKVAPCPLPHIPNARTRKTLRDADAGKNLIDYPSLEAMFEDLGI